MAIKIHLASEQDEPHATVKRKLGALNVGLYCTHCAEFFALAVIDDGVPIEVVSEGPIPFRCPMCGHLQRRDATEIAQIVLTESNKRRPPPPKGAH